MEEKANEETVLQNETPDVITGVFSSGIVLLQQYGWFVLVGVIAIIYLKSRFLNPRLSQWQQKREDASYKKMDSGKAQSQLEAMERARQRMQEQLDAQGAEYMVKQKEKEEKARQDKITDWERHQEGKGYRSKYRPTENNEAGPSRPSQAKPKPKKPLKDPDYNPLSGTSGPSCGFRPGRRGGGAEGG